MAIDEHVRDFTRANCTTRTTHLLLVLATYIRRIRLVVDTTSPGARALKENPNFMETNLYNRDLTAETRQRLLPALESGG